MARLSLPAAGAVIEVGRAAAEGGPGPHAGLSVTQTLSSCAPESVRCEAALRSKLGSSRAGAAEVNIANQFGVTRWYRGTVLPHVDGVPAGETCALRGTVVVALSV